jgi:hypothetical protein
MITNMGTIDRTLRILFAVAVVVLYFMNVISGTVALILGIISLIFFITGLVGHCPLYGPLHFSTKR